MTAFGRIIEIWRYPVSSMGGERLEETPLDARGIEHDRIWGVVERENGEVAAPEKRKHWRPLPNLFSRMTAAEPDIGNGDGTWYPASSREAQDLVTRFLGFPAALRPHTAYGTESEGKVAPRYERADIHLLTTASMRTLASLLPDPAEVDPRRFRPSIVVETELGFEGFVEHQIVGKKLAVGNATITISEPCARCSFTALAQGNLAFEPAVLQKISQHGKGGFGVLCKIDTPAVIRVGDAVTLVEA